jgi:hypothetical protein
MSYNYNLPFFKNMFWKNGHVLAVAAIIWNEFNILKKLTSLNEGLILSFAVSSVSFSRLSPWIWYSECFHYELFSICFSIIFFFLKLIKMRDKDFLTSTPKMYAEFDRTAFCFSCVGELMIEMLWWRMPNK